jgi:hypothetical protein
MKPPVKFIAWGNHHLYYGISFLAFGTYNLILGIGNGNLDSLSPLWISIMGFGVFCVIDDLIEHLVTSETPLRKLYLFLFKLKE